MASDIDLKPTAQMASNAERGLALREKHGKGGTAVGVARARDIKNRKNLSPSTVRRMHSFFSRHDGNQSGGEDDAGYIAWMLWGGDAGQSWSKRKVDEMDNKSKNAKGVEFDPYGEAMYEYTNRVKPRGRGRWGFTAPDGSLVRPPTEMTYSEAKAWLKKNAPMPGRYKVATSRASGPGSKQKFGTHKVADYGPFQLWWVGDPGGSRYFQVKKGSMTIPFNDGDKAEQYIATHGGIGYIVQRAYKDFWNDGFGDFVTSHRAMDKLTKRDLEMFLKDAIEMYEDEEDTQMVAQAKKVMRLVSSFSRPGAKAKMGRAEKVLRDGSVHLDFKAAEAWLQSLTDDQLRYIVQDARAAANAMPDGKKWNYYHDLALTAGDELGRRKRWDPARKKNLIKNDRPGATEGSSKTKMSEPRWERWYAKDGPEHIREAEALIEKCRAKRAEIYDTEVNNLPHAIRLMRHALQNENATSYNEAYRIILRSDRVRSSFSRPGAKPKFDKSAEIRARYTALRKMPKSELFALWQRKMQRGRVDVGGKMNEMDKDWLASDIVNAEYNRRDVDAAFASSRPGAKAKFGQIETMLAKASAYVSEGDDEASGLIESLVRMRNRGMLNDEESRELSRVIKEARQMGVFSRPGAKAKFGYELEKGLYDSLHRFFHHDERGLALLKKHGEEKVDRAITAAARDWSDLEEVGSSDMWIIIRSAIRNLGETPKFSRPGAKSKFGLEKEINIVLEEGRVPDLAYDWSNGTLMVDPKWISKVRRVISDSGVIVPDRLQRFLETRVKQTSGTIGLSRPGAEEGKR
jgi:hypothetical protein